MKKQTLKLTALALAAALAMTPQSALAAKSDRQILTSEEKAARYEASAVHYIYDENAGTKANSQ